MTLPTVATPKKSDNRIWLYNQVWPKGTNALQIEIDMLRRGGQWLNQKGNVCGNGIEFHFRRFQELLYGKAKVWHRWNEMQMKLYCDYGNHPPELLPETDALLLKKLGDRRQYRTIVGIGPKSCGKAQPLNSTVWTPIGPKKMGEMRIGDWVCVPHYSESKTKPYAKVTGVYPQGERDVYRILFTDGATVEASDEHLWMVGHKTSGWNPKWRPMTTEMMFRLFRETKLSPGLLQIRTPEPLVFFSWPKENLHPYLLGVLLGDGGLTGKGSIVISSVDQELLDRIKPMIPKGLTLKHRDRCSYGISGSVKNGGRVPNALKDTLCSYGVYGKPAWEKSIPRAFLYGSIEDRMELLRGLFDTDGYVNRLGTAVIFYTSSPQLAKDVQFLIESLGGVCRIGQKETTYVYKGEKKSGRMHYICTVTYHDPSSLFSLTRKKSRCKPRTRSVGVRAIQSIEHIGKHPVQCIMVDHPDHLYLTDHCVVTHNTFSAATDSLADYYIWPECTAILFTTTTRESLENRVWGELKKYHRIAKRRWPWLPGHLIDGRQRIVTDARDEDSEEGRDFRAGLQGMACKKGNEMVNIADFSGLKQTRVRVVADELSHFPKSFVDVISNLDSNPDFVFYGLGNPKETTDALGYIGEPATNIGGWEGGIDQKPGTKTWALKRPQGIAFHLPGDDSPNLDGSMSIPLITKAMMDRDEAFYGQDSWQYQMMNLGRMPKGQGSRRVLTRQLCLKFGAMNPPIWLNHMRKKIAFLDAAYRGVGGDRCIFGVLEFGEEVPDDGSAIYVDRKHKKIIALTDLLNVPITNSDTELPEDQIVLFVKNQCMARGIPPEDFFFDAGMRTSLVQAFSRVWSANVESVDCGGRPTSQMVSLEINIPACDYYSKFITELWYAVRLTVESRQLRGLTEDAMYEFCLREWKTVGANKIEVESKEEMKVKSGRSPDLADAIAIGLFGARQRGFVITKLGASSGGNDTPIPDWHRRLRSMARDIRMNGQLKTA